MFALAQALLLLPLAAPQAVQPPGGDLARPDSSESEPIYCYTDWSEKYGIPLKPIKCPTGRSACVSIAAGGPARGRVYLGCADLHSACADSASDLYCSVCFTDNCNKSPPYFSNHVHASGINSREGWHRQGQKNAVLQAPGDLTVTESPTETPTTDPNTTQFEYHVTLTPLPFNYTTDPEEYSSSGYWDDLGWVLFWWVGPFWPLLLGLLVALLLCCCVPLCLFFIWRGCCCCIRERKCTSNDEVQKRSGTDPEMGINVSSDMACSLHPEVDAGSGLAPGGIIRTPERDPDSGGAEHVYKGVAVDGGTSSSPQHGIAVVVGQPCVAGNDPQSPVAQTQLDDNVNDMDNIRATVLSLPAENVEIQAPQVPDAVKDLNYVQGLCPVHSSGGHFKDLCKENHTDADTPFACNSSKVNTKERLSSALASSLYALGMCPKRSNSATFCTCSPDSIAALDFPEPKLMEIKKCRMPCGITNGSSAAVSSRLRSNKKTSTLYYVSGADGAALADSASSSPSGHDTCKGKTIPVDVKTFGPDT